MLQYSYESLTITLFGSYQPLHTQSRRYPSGQIEPLLVLAGSRHFKAFTNLRPPSSQARMQAKAGLILENNDFIEREVT